MNATLDLQLDLATATAEQLADQRTALLARLTTPQAGDDVAALAARAGEITDAIKTAAHTAAAADQARAALMAAVPINAPASPAEQRAGVQATTPQAKTDETPKARSLGEAFTQSTQYRASMAAGVNSVQRAVIDTRAFVSSEYPSEATRVPGIQAPNRDTPLTILDLIDRQSVSTNAIEWVQEVEFTNGAAEVAEGKVKPESKFGFELKQDVMAQIAHWVDITRAALADETQLQGYINGRLTYGLEKRLNAQVLNGDGTTPNLRGILTTPGIGLYTGTAGDDSLIQIRKARTVAELSEYVPDGVVLHPSDWEDVELSHNANGTFRLVTSVADGGTPRVWGLTVISTVNMTAGTFLVGGFREGATLWERTGIEIYVTDSDADKFRFNILTLLAEKRAGLSVWRPKAFVKGTFTA